MTPARRDFALRDLGCVVAFLREMPWLPAEKHHLLTTGMHGNGKRRGEQYTVGLNSWSHRGVVLPGWTEDECRERLGPSYAREPALFRATYPDELLLNTTNQRIEQWTRNTVGA